MRVIIRAIYVFLCLAGIILSSQSTYGADTTLVRDLVHDWYFYDDGSESYFPLVSKSAFSGETIHFEIDQDEYPGNLLRLATTKPVSMFINNKMVDVVEGLKYYSLDSIKSNFSGRLHITLYHKYLDVYELDTRVVKLSPAIGKPLAENPIIVRARQVHPFHNFAVLAFVIIGACFAALYNYVPRVFNEFLKVTKAFALRDSDENLFKTRPLNIINLLMYLFLSFLVALVLMLIVYWSGFHLELSLFNAESFIDGVWKWLRLSLLIMAWLFFKYIIVFNLSALFRLGSFMVSHYFNYIRMGLFIFIIFLILIVVSYFGFGIYSATYYATVFYVLLGFLGLRVVILFFKLMSSAPYKTLHLFSYLCGTEVIPFGVFLYLGLNQPF